MVEINLETLSTKEVVMKQKCLRKLDKKYRGGSSWDGNTITSLSLIYLLVRNKKVKVSITYMATWGCLPWGYSLNMK